MAKHSKHFRLTVLQHRRDIIFDEQREAKKYNGDIPVHLLWKQRANRLEETLRGY